MFRGFGVWEIVLILVIVLIVFGVGKLPQVGGAIGKGLREFRQGQRGEYGGEEEESEKVASEKVVKSQAKKQRLDRIKPGSSLKSI